MTLRRAAERGRLVRNTLYSFVKAANMSTVLFRDWLYIGNLQLSLIRFVSASAAAGGNGSAAQPYQRITQGLTGAAAGSIVHVLSQ